MDYVNALRVHSADEIGLGYVSYAVFFSSKQNNANKNKRCIIIGICLVIYCFGLCSSMQDKRCD